MKRLAALFLGLMVLTGPALSAPIGVLVEERARTDYADSLPQDGEFEITVKDAPADAVLTLAEFWMDPRSGKFLANAVLETGEVQR
ncbi:MAG: flagella basal body P-ring formation protein FlgA, partial [Alphaproteobacteria bacterium]